MRGTIVVSSSRADEVAHWAVDRYRIPCWFHTAETELALGVGHKLAAQVHRRLLWILLFVETLGRGVPNVDLSTGDRFAILILDQTFDEKCRPWRGRAHNRTTIFGARRIHAPERTELIGCGFGLPVIAVVDQA